MKRYQLCGAFCMILGLLVAGTAWAADQPASPNEAPAILASLDAANVTILDDQATMAIRGQAAYKTAYVLVKTLGINALDFGSDVQWTWNPLGYRYGYWGGPGWSNGGVTNDSSYSSPTADLMDELFKAHDLAYAAYPNNSDRLIADKGLLAGLSSLKTTPNPYWGWIYSTTPVGREKLSPDVYVSGVSFIGNKIFLGWRPMPYSEYARREALAGLGIMVFARSVSIPLQ